MQSSSKNSSVYGVFSGFGGRDALEEEVFVAGTGCDVLDASANAVYDLQDDFL